MKKVMAVSILSLVALLTGGYSTAMAGNCACKNNECQSGFSACWFDDAGTCITVSGRCPTPITLLPGTDVTTRLVDEQRITGDESYAFAGCAQVLSERSLTPSRANELRSVTQHITL